MLSRQVSSRFMHSSRLITIQSLAQTKTEKETAVGEATNLKQSEATLRAECETLRAKLDSVQAEFDSVSNAHAGLQATHAELSSQSQKNASALADLNRKLSIESGKQTLTEKKVKTLQSEVAAANKRADEAELAHKGLQNENVGLMASLNEMRPKVMQLTEEKLSLMEVIEKVEESKYALEGTISQLEGQIDEVKAKCESLEEEKKALEKERDADQENATADVERIQVALSQTEEELQIAVRSIQDLETERNVHRQAVERYQLEMDRLDSELAELRAQHSTLQDELAIQRSAREADAVQLIESAQVVERAHIEVENLRNDLYIKDEEIEQLRADLMQAQVQPAAKDTDGKTPRPGHGRRESLDKEMFESDGTFELSQARSKIRLLESTVFQEQAKAHSLRKQISSLEEELHRVRRTSTALHTRPPPPPSSTHSEEREMEMALDSALPPEVRHKRKISLSMLKARIDGEKAMGASPRPAARHLSSLGPTTEEEEEPHEKMPLNRDPGPSTSRAASTSGHVRAPVMDRRRPQFLDESHVFWCGTCKGDLVVL